MKTRTEYQQQIIDKEKEMKSEPFCVVVKMEWMPFLIRITYTKQKSDKIVSIEEVSGVEETVVSCCKFRGRSNTGNCGQDIIELKRMLTKITPKDLMLNEQFVDAYYQKH